MPKKYLTVNEVARIIGVTPLTVRNWDKKGRLAAYRHPINNYRIYKIEDVELLLKRIEYSDRPPLADNSTKRLKVEME